MGRRDPARKKRVLERPTGVGVSQRVHVGLGSGRGTDRDAGKPFEQDGSAEPVVTVPVRDVYICVMSRPLLSTHVSSSRVVSVVKGGSPRMACCSP